MFRRVHIKAKKAINHVQWSAINKHPLLNLDKNGLDISLTDDTVWPAGVKGLAVHADKHYDHNFFYYEITVSSDEPYELSTLSFWYSLMMAESLA